MTALPKTDKPDKDKPVYNICGRREFELGPNSRKSSTGKLPRCTGCQLPEQHPQLCRIYSQIQPSYLLQITVPTPCTRAVTVDWGYPKPEAHVHYRGYGKDFIERFREARPGAITLQIETFAALRVPAAASISRR